jgi:hypothetical protein
MKNGYGITDAKLEELRLIGLDHELIQRVNFLSLLKFSKIFVSHARDLAKSGQKDEARNWLRFFQNSQLVEILAYQTTTVIPPGELKKLSDDLKLLNGECHPLDVADWTTEIEAIRWQLDYIIKNLPRRNMQAVRPGASLTPSRTGRLNSFVAPLPRQTSLRIRSRSKHLTAAKL